MSFNITIDKAKLVFTLKNIVYTLFWAIVSLVSSFNQIISSIHKIVKGDFSPITDEDFYTKIISPLLIWIIAFFVDFLYQLWTIGKNEQLNPTWIKASYFAIFSVFVTLLISLFYHSCELQKIASIICLFSCIILLKVSALYVVSPSYEVEKR